MNTDVSYTCPHETELHPSLLYMLYSIPGGGDANLHHPLYFLQHFQDATLHTHSKLFDFWYIHIWHIAKFHAFRWLRSKFMVILGLSVAQRIKIVLSKSLKTEYAIKSRNLFCFESTFNTIPILILKIQLKLDFKKFQIWTPYSQVANRRVGFNKRGVRIFFKIQ